MSRLRLPLAATRHFGQSSDIRSLFLIRDVSCCKTSDNEMSEIVRHRKTAFAVCVPPESRGPDPYDDLLDKLLFDLVGPGGGGTGGPCELFSYDNKSGDGAGT